MKKSILLLLLPAFLLLSCGDGFTSLAPLSQRNVKNFYKTASDFEVAVNGVYDALQTDGTYNKNYILMLEMRSDNGQNDGGATGLAQSIERIDQFNELNDNGQINDTWSASYEGIARANKILDQLEGADISQDVADRVLGEALFLRSLLYYNLAVTFGNIPLQMESVTSTQVDINQVDAATIYQQIAADLETAASLLPEAYSGDNVGRATTYAASTLLGKVYLTMGQNSEAESALRQVLGNFQLADSYADLWGVDNANNVESIFEIQFKSGGLGEGSAFTDIYTVTETGVGGGNIPQDPTDDLLASYEPGDQRLDITYDTTAADNTNDPNEIYVAKFDGPIFNPLDGELNWIELRYADVLLMLAEAIGESPEAYGYINEVRQRSGLGPIDSSTPGTFEEKLLKERRHEFAFENKRWPDLKRFGMAKQVMAGQLGLPESRITLLFPIPQQEISVKPDQMQQNPEHQ